MRIKMKMSLSGLDFSYYEGQEIVIKDSIAKEWIAAGVAEDIKEEKTTKMQNNSKD